MNSPVPLLTQSSSADFWQKSHNNSYNHHPSQQQLQQRGGGAPGAAATNGELAAAYWSPAGNPFYGGKGGGGGGQPPPSSASPSMKQRFPLQLPSQQQVAAAPSLPRARLREEGRYQQQSPPQQLQQNGNSIGYKLANQRVGAPPMMMNVVMSEQQQRSPYQQLQLKQQPGVWTVEAERLARDARRPVQQQQQGKLLQMQQPPPPGMGKYGDKPSRGTPPREKQEKGEKEKSSSGGGGGGGTRKQQPQRWGRFMQTLCCCIAPNRENAEKLPPNMNGTPSNSEKVKQVQPPPLQQQQLQQGYANGNGTAAMGGGGGGPPANLITQIQKPSPTAVSASPITQITQNGNGTSGLNGATAYQQAEITVSPGSYKPPPLEKLLLPPLQPRDVNRKCLIIDLDETLVHSSFKPVKNPDFVIPVEIDGVVHQVYVLKRPYVDEFLARVGEKFECVLFTASLAKYADPVADLLDKRGVFRSRLFREACVFHKGNYIKDLARLGRDLNRTLIVDNSPTSYLFHPENAIPVQTWFDDPSDVELLDILPLLDRLAQVDSVYSVLRGTNASPDSAALLDRPYS
ncbi:hypothetical protein PFISCL1PPCAC_4586 [Pristionchus fissidentatus]|uniref:protein-serine/threonine phosphatase n=1 Tax=Pristionchus fissidentatus TaxID=1538716 RepID=A0AAV5V416_9BILA|nr:hypothetical protein PFISCL1PPCAC_4586 [Pristionchus fissidentatus]